MLTTEQQEISRKNKYNERIANTICVELGGQRKLKMFINAKRFTIIDRGVQFSRTRGQSGTGNTTKITLNGLDMNGSDMYDVEQLEVRFSQKAGVTSKVKTRNENVYADQLEQVIYNATGLVLSL